MIIIVEALKKQEKKACCWMLTYYVTVEGVSWFVCVVVDAVHVKCNMNARIHGGSLVIKLVDKDNV